MKKPLLIFSLFILFCSFKNTQAQVAKPLPEGAVPIVVTYPNYSIFIPAKINDSVEGHFYFDTGAGNLSFDSTFYANAFSPFSKSSARVGGVGTGGTQTVPRIVDSLDFIFGDHVHRTTNINISNRKIAHGDFYDGMIGHQFFSENKYVMEINYIDEYMILHDDISSIDLSGYTKIEKKKENRGAGLKFYVPVTIQVNDTLTIEEEFLFDTGSGNSVYISMPTAKKYNLSGLSNNKVRAVTNSAGFSGRTTAIYFRANSIIIGGHTLNNIGLAYSEDQSGSMASPHVSGGLLGTRTLHHFDMIIDFGDEPALYLKPNRNFGTPFEDVSVYRGFGYADRSQTLKGWVVRGFFDGTNAHHSGMQAGDKIIFVNGISVLDIPFEEQHDFWKNLEEVELIVLRDDEELKFEFELNPSL